MGATAVFRINQSLQDINAACFHEFVVSHKKPNFLTVEHVGSNVIAKFDTRLATHVNDTSSFGAVKFLSKKLKSRGFTGVAVDFDTLPSAGEDKSVPVLTLTFPATTHTSKQLESLAASFEGDLSRVRLIEGFRYQGKRFGEFVVKNVQRMGSRPSRRYEPPVLAS